MKKTFVGAMTLILALLIAPVANGALLISTVGDLVVEQGGSGTIEILATGVVDPEVIFGFSLDVTASDPGFQFTSATATGSAAPYALPAGAVAVGAPFVANGTPLPTSSLIASDVEFLGLGTPVGVGQTVSLGSLATPSDRTYPKDLFRCSLDHSRLSQAQLVRFRSTCNLPPSMWCLSPPPI